MTADAMTTSLVPGDRSASRRTTTPAASPRRSRRRRRCAAHLRLTPVRRRVLEILLEEHRALGAYDILARLAEEGLGSQPPVAYRALDFLVRARLRPPDRAAERLRRLRRPGEEDHAAAFMICRRLRRGGGGRRRAAPAGAARPRRRRRGFRIERAVVEAEGLCAGCRGGGRAMSLVTADGPGRRVARRAAGAVAASTWRSRRARSSPSSGRTGRARRRSCARSSARCRRRPGGSRGRRACGSATCRSGCTSTRRCR